MPSHNFKKKAKKKSETAMRLALSIDQSALRLLCQVAIVLSVLLDRRACRLIGGRKELHRMAALRADLVVEVESFDFLRQSLNLTVFFRAAFRRKGRRHDLFGKIVLWFLIRAISNDRRRRAICTNIVILLTYVTTNSSQWVPLVG